MLAKISCQASQRLTLGNPLRRPNVCCVWIQVFHRQFLPFLPLILLCRHRQHIMRSLIPKIFSATFNHQRMHNERLTHVPREIRSPISITTQLHHSDGKEKFSVFCEYKKWAISLESGSGPRIVYSLQPGSTALQLKRRLPFTLFEFFFIFSLDFRMIKEAIMLRSRLRLSHVSTAVSNWYQMNDSQTSKMHLAFGVREHWECKSIHVWCACTRRRHGNSKYESCTMTVHLVLLSYHRRAPALPRHVNYHCCSVFTSDAACFNGDVKWVKRI